MFLPFKRGLFGSVSIVASIVITALVLLWLWSMINPSGLLYQVIAAILLLAFGAIICVSLVFFFTAVTLLLFMFLLKRKVNKSMKQLFKRVG